MDLFQILDRNKTYSPTLSFKLLHYTLHTHWLRLYSLQKTVRAMYDYAAADSDEVSFKDGDVIVNVQSIDEGWMYGTVQRTGKTGMLPANYVEAV